jgi:hypothetical protein
MFHYRLYGEDVSSSQPLFRQIKTDVPVRQRVSLTITRTESVSKNRLAFFHRIRDEDGRLVSSFARGTGCLVVRFHRKADFLISLDGSRVQVRVMGEATEDEVQALLLTNVIPLALNQAGHEIIHACAVEISGKAVAFVGQQGFGKSTLSAALVKRGYKLLTDDALRISTGDSIVRAYPSFPEIRLEKKNLLRFTTKDQAARFQAALFEKKRMPVKNFVAQALPLGAVYLINTQKKTEVVRVTPAGPAEAFRGLLENSFRLDLFNPLRMHREMDTLSKIAQTTPAWRLEYPKCYEALDGAIEAVLSSFSPEKKHGT